jgi:uncharacterized protein (TIGR03083 family)
MDPASYLASIKSDGDALEVAATGNLERRVPACPEWEVADLLAHLGGVYGWVRSALEAAGQPPARSFPEAPKDRDQLLPWFTEQRDGLLAELAGRDPQGPAWVFISSEPQQVWWWYRRQALETAVHRFDAQASIGNPEPVEASLAIEGVDEFLTGFLSRVIARAPVDALTGTFHLHATDAPGEWWLDLDTEDFATRREHAKADTAVRGPASGLYLWLWNRQTPEEAGLEVFGNGSVIRAWSDVKI